MKAVRISICGLGLLMLLAHCALCSQTIWTEEKITPAGSQAGGPVVWGDKVYYSDYSSGKGEIYVWDRAGGSRLFLSGPTSMGVSAVYGENMVFGRYIGGQFDMYMYDPINGERTITTAPGNQYNASIHGNTVVYEDHGTGVSQIHMWDPVNGDRAIAPSSNNQITPKIYGDTVVWEEGYQDPFYDWYMPSVYMWDSVNGTRLIGEGLRSPAIYGDKITMFQQDPDRYSGGSFLYQYSISTGIMGRYATVSGRSVSSVNMWGDTVVWYAGDTSSNVGAWDPIHGVTYVNQSNRGHAYTPSIYGRYVAWTDRSSVYLSTIVPEPSALVSLALGILGLAPCLRRHRREH